MSEENKTVEAEVQAGQAKSETANESGKEKRQARGKSRGGAPRGKKTANCCS